MKRLLYLILKVFFSNSNLKFGSGKELWNNLFLNFFHSGPDARVICKSFIGFISEFFVTTLSLIFDNAPISFEDNIILLPNHDFKYGIINNSVANLRKNPSHSSELVSQTILGTGVSILKKKGEWYLIQTPDKYISWIDHGGIVAMSKEKYDNYFASDVGVFTRPYGFSYETKKKNKVVSDLVLGSALKIIEYEYPDGRKAWIENRLMNSISSIRGMNYSIQNLLENAHSLIGVPYLWGGTSSKGFDCSGYTKSVYLMNGYILPRDASQQVKEGILVDNSRNWNLLEAGDLMFFGYYKDDKLRIDHVSIWLGDGYFIQSSKNVRISSVYSDNSNFDDLE